MTKKHIFVYIRCAQFGELRTSKGKPALTTVMLPMVVNTSEWNDYKFGYKLVGMTNSAASFGSKVGAALGSALMGAVLSAGGYNPKLAAQTPSSIRSICYINIHIIGLCLIVIFICFLF